VLPTATRDYTGTTECTLVLSCDWNCQAFACHTTVSSNKVTLVFDMAQYIVCAAVLHIAYRM
jgi:hypothetical protein